jgi:hypothetical protein
MTALLVLLAFLVMEPLTYAAHRWVMHGQTGIAWHESHHEATSGGWERNDWYPVVFAAAGLLTSVARPRPWAPSTWLLRSRSGAGLRL